MVSSLGAVRYKRRVYQDEQRIRRRIFEGGEQLEGGATVEIELTVGVTFVAVGGSGVGVAVGAPSPQAVSIKSGTTIEYGKRKNPFVIYIPFLCHPNKLGRMGGFEQRQGFLDGTQPDGLEVSHLIDPEANGREFPPDGTFRVAVCRLICMP